MSTLCKAAVRFLLVVIVGSTLTVRADTIELVDGSIIQVQSPNFKDGQLTLDDGRIIPREQIKRILFAHGKAAGADASQTGDSNVPDLLRQAEAAKEKYPDVGAIVLIDDGEYVLRPDGTQHERTHNAFLILKEEWKSAAEIGHMFEEGRQRVTLVRARTISPDGTVHDFDPARLRESKPTEGMVSFNEEKAVTGQLPEVTLGSIVEYVWDMETYNPYDKELFFGSWMFASTEPFIWSRLTVRIPRSRTLFFHTEDMPAEAATPKITEEGDQRIYQWEMRDVPHVVPEPAMPPMSDVVPRVSFSILESWDYLFDFLGKFQREHVQRTPEIDARVAAIVGDSTAPEEKLAKIYHWLQREIRYISIKGSLGSAWSGHPAAQTLENEYGDCVDMAILFTAMLDAVDIKAYPVIVSTNDAGALDRSLPTLRANHALTKVYLDGKPRYLDTTASTFRYPSFRPDDHGVNTINVLEREIGFIPVPPPEDNQIDIYLDMSVDAEGNVDAGVRLGMTGAAEAALRQGLEQINKIMLKMAAQQAINSISPGAVLNRIETSDEKDLTEPLTLTMNVRLPTYPTFAGQLMIFPLPLHEMIHQFAETSLEERLYDIDYLTSGQIRLHMRLDLPEGYVPKGLPGTVNLHSKYAEYNAAYRMDGPTIVFEDCLSRADRIVPRADYATYKDFLEEVAEFARQPVFLYKIQDPT